MYDHNHLHSRSGYVVSEFALNRFFWSTVCLRASEYDMGHAIHFCSPGKVVDLLDVQTAGATAAQCHGY